MKHIVPRALRRLLLASLVGACLVPPALADERVLAPHERAHLRDQLREAHKQRMLEHHRRGATPAAAGSFPERGGGQLHMSVEEREALRHQLREQRRALRREARHQREGVSAPGDAGRGVAPVNPPGRGSR
jgi:uncharacterized membrane protein